MNNNYSVNSPGKDYYNYVTPPPPPLGHIMPQCMYQCVLYSLAIQGLGLSSIDPVSDFNIISCDRIWVVERQKYDVNISWSGNFSEIAVTSGIRYFTVDVIAFINDAIQLSPPLPRLRVDTQVSSLALAVMK